MRVRVFFKCVCAWVCAWVGAGGSTPDTGRGCRVCLTHKQGQLGRGPGWGGGQRRRGQAAELGGQGRSRRRRRWWWCNDGREVGHDCDCWRERVQVWWCARLIMFRTEQQLLLSTFCANGWLRVEWSGVEWSGVEWSGVEWSGIRNAYRHR
jgi:hypothetical protein